MSGELIGIVNAKQSSTGIEGLGFAIPANIVFKDIEDILEYGYITGRATLGVTVQYGTNKTIGKTGVFVTEAGNTAFKNMDQIIQIGDDKNGEVKTMVEYNIALKKLSVSSGKTVTVNVLVKRYNKEQKCLETIKIAVTAYENKSQY
jgi:serine protease Do